MQSIPENAQNPANVAKEKLDMPTFENNIINSLVVEEVAQNSTTLVKATPNLEKVAPNTPPFEKAAQNTPPFVKGGPGGISKKGNSL